MKKNIYIILILAVIGGGIYAWFYFSKPGAANNLAVSSLPSVSSSLSLPSPSYTIADTFPKTETIGIGTTQGTIEVKNFYKMLADTEEGSVIMKENENYKIFYDRSTSRFYIYLTAPSASQSQAETDLLSILGVGQQDACKLNVLVFQPGQSNGTNLSFCAGRVK